MHTKYEKLRKDFIGEFFFMLDNHVYGKQVKSFLVDHKKHLHKFLRNQKVMSYFLLIILIIYHINNSNVMFLL